MKKNKFRYDLKMVRPHSPDDFSFRRNQLSGWISSLESIISSYKRELAFLDTLSSVSKKLNFKKGA